MQTLDKDYDKITFYDLTPSLQKKILESAEIVQDELIRHKMDSTSHVSGDEKIIWNAKGGSTETDVDAGWTPIN